MSRSGYSDDYENLALWRNAVERALKGKRGQAFLRELLEALDAMAKKELIRLRLVSDKGECCTLGAVFIARNIEIDDALDGYDGFDPDHAADVLGIASAMVQEITYLNDEFGKSNDEDPAQRWVRMREWVASQIKA